MSNDTTQTRASVMAFARQIPRSARVAQGFGRVQDFAAHVARVRAERARRQKVTRPPRLANATAALQAAVDADAVLRRAARQAAGLTAGDGAPVVVRYDGAGYGGRKPKETGSHFVKYHWRNGAASGTVYHPSTRRVVAPAEWVVRTIRAAYGMTAPAAEIVDAHRRALAERAAMRERRRQRREQCAMQKLQAIPHWLDRAAIGAIEVPAALPAELRLQIERRRREINERVRLRRQRRPKPQQPLRNDMASPDMRVRAIAHRTRHGAPFSAVAAVGQNRVRMLYVPGHVDRSLMQGLVLRPAHEHCSTLREAVRAWVRSEYIRRAAESGIAVWHAQNVWTARLIEHACEYIWTGHRRPRLGLLRELADVRRRQIAERTRRMAERLESAKPDSAAPDTLGWRCWLWDSALKRLRSPHRGTVWRTACLSAEHWSDEGAVRGVSGIHARRMPQDWLRAGWIYMGHQEGDISDARLLVHGIVERFGRYVLGDRGWRAEHVMIHELAAPSVPVMLALMEAYPGVRVTLDPHAVQHENEEVGHGDRSNH